MAIPGPDQFGEWSKWIEREIARSFMIPQARMAPTMSIASMLETVDRVFREKPKSESDPSLVFPREIRDAMGMGIRISPSPYWPRVPNGTETKRIPAHAIIRWLARWLPIKPYVEAEVPVFKDANVMLDRRPNTLFCSHAQAAMIRELLRR